MPIRNLGGGGLAVLRGWSLHPERAQDEHATVEEFNPLTCDLHLAGSETVVWQSMLGDSASPAYTTARQALLARQPLSLEILYGDQDETQRTIARFDLTPASQDGTWLAAVNRHGNLDPLRPWGRIRPPRSATASITSGTPCPRASRAKKWISGPYSKPPTTGVKTMNQKPMPWK